MAPLRQTGAAFALGAKERELASRETKRYRTLRSFLEERFPFPVWPIFVDSGASPPTRYGLSQTGGCLYCYSQGPPTSLQDPPVPVAEQVSSGLERLRRRHPSACAIASFRPSSNAHAPIDVLQRRYGEALEVDGVVGIAVGVRSEDLTEEALRLLEGIAKTHEVWLEMGPQTVHDEQRALVDRSEISAHWVEAVEIAAGRGIHQVIHLILGLPGEERAETLETVNTVAALPVDGVKVHHLMVREETDLAHLWRRRHFTLISAEAYIDLAVAVLEHLPPEAVIHQLVAEPNPGERLLAPRWRQSPEEMLVTIDAELARRDTRQGARLTRRKESY
ncbi:MAG: TIGR01212 family radical SAM protein [Nitrospinae bacterium]|nr:TIGR01212 family radical SAM protein [Nitrospinota bacterium]